MSYLRIPNLVFFFLFGQEVSFWSQTEKILAIDVFCFFLVLLSLVAQFPATWEPLLTLARAPPSTFLFCSKCLSSRLDSCLIPASKGTLHGNAAGYFSSLQAGSGWGEVSPMRSWIHQQLAHGCFRSHWVFKLVLPLYLWRANSPPQSLWASCGKRMSMFESEPENTRN